MVSNLLLFLYIWQRQIFGRLLLESNLVAGIIRVCDVNVPFLEGLNIHPKGSRWWWSTFAFRDVSRGRYSKPANPLIPRISPQEPDKHLQFCALTHTIDLRLGSTFITQPFFSLQVIFCVCWSVFRCFFHPFNLLREPVYFTGSCYPFVRECIEENSPLAEAGSVELGWEPGPRRQCFFYLAGGKRRVPRVPVTNSNFFGGKQLFWNLKCA